MNLNGFKLLTAAAGLMAFSSVSHALIITDELESIRVLDVGNSFQTVNTQQTYADLIVVCTYALPASSNLDAVVRIDNITGTSFDVRIQNPGNSAAVTAADVYCIVADEGDWTLPDGTIFDAHKEDSNQVVGNLNIPNWNQLTMENVSGDIDGAYASNEDLAVLGQVMSYNDTDFSVFTSSDCDIRQNPPFNSNLADGICVGKHVGKVSGVAAARNTETLGYIVVQEDSGSFDGISYVSALGGDSVAGVDNSPPYVYSVGAHYDFGAATQTAEDGGDGSWAVMYGSDPLAGNNLDIAVDEETITKAARTHTTEQVSYWLFAGVDHSDAPISYGDASHAVTGLLSLGASADGDADAESVAQTSATAVGDDADGFDDEDGVVFRSVFGDVNSVFADVEVTNPKGLTVNVCAWLDIVAGAVVDGIFDAADGLCQSTSAVNPTLTFEWPGLPTDQSYTTFARFRATTDALTTANAVSAATDGEVEDYQINFDFQPTAVTLSDVKIDNVALSILLDDLTLEELNDLLGLWAPGLGETVDTSSYQAILDGLLDYLDPDGDGNVTVFSWSTMQELGTIGFYVERQLSDGSWYRVNDELLPGLITAPMGGEYKLLDPRAQESLGRQSSGLIQYRLIELEADADIKEYGPFELLYQ